MNRKTRLGVALPTSDLTKDLPEDNLREILDWRTLEKCPECHSTELRHDVTCGETDCVTCGWSLDWKGTE